MMFEIMFLIQFHIWHFKKLFAKSRDFLEEITTKSQFGIQLLMKYYFTY